MLKGSPRGSSSSSLVTTTGATTARTLANHFADVHNAADWGVTADGKQLVDCNLTNGLKVVSSSTYNFTQADVGKTVVFCPSDGSSVLNTVIDSVASNNATLHAAWAGTTISDNTGRMTFYTTDNTALLQAAIDAIVALHADKNGHNMTGFKLMLPDGVIATGTITIPRFCILAAAGGVQASTLFLKSGVNAALLTSENFATLTGTGAIYGTNANVPAWFGIENMHLDGNRAGQSTGNCISFYGNAQLLLGSNLIENAKVYNIYREGAGGYAYSATDWRSQEEGYAQQVVTRNAGSYGILDRGPHDSVWESIISNENGSTNYRSEASGSLYVGSAHIGSIHTYTSGDGTGQYYGAGGTIGKSYSDTDNVTLNAGMHIGQLYQIQGGAHGLNLLEITANANYTQIGTHSMDFLSDATNLIGINIAAGAGPVTIGHSIGAGVPGTSGITLIKNRANFATINAHASNAQGVGSIGLDHAADFCHYSGSMFNNKTGVSWGGGDYNYLNMSIYRGSGAAELSGTPSATNIIRINSDQSASNLFYTPPVVEANTAGVGSPNILTGVEGGKYFTNEGAAAKNYHTLPSAAANLGPYTFICEDADGIRITAASGDTIRLANTVSATAGYAESTSIGSVVILIAINATEWIATSVTGTWSVV